MAACAAFDFFVCNDPWCGSVCKKYVGVECDFHFAVCFETAGKQGLGVPKLTIGQYTYIMNGVLVLGQILVQAEVTGIDIVNALYIK